MIPEESLSTTPVDGDYLYPAGLYTTPTQDYELGGVAIQDTSEGLEVQGWFCYLDPDTDKIYLCPVDSVTPIEIAEQVGVIELSVAFDQSMRWVLALLLESGDLKFYWYDTVIADYTITTFTDIVSVKTTLDDKRPLQILRDNTDVILTYIKSDNNLYYRQQRDRYEIEYLLYEDCPPNNRISNFGMTSQNRLKWRFQLR